MFGLGMQELLVIAFVALLLFGGRKIPELMRGLGQGVKSFKEGMSETTSQKKDTDESGDINHGDGSSHTENDEKPTA